MPSVVVSETIPQPRGRVFEAAADPLIQRLWDANTLLSIEKLDPGPLGPGARYRGKFKGMGTVEFDYSMYEPISRFQHHSRMPVGEMFHTFELEEAPGGGTRL